MKKNIVILIFIITALFFFIADIKVSAAEMEVMDLQSKTISLQSEIAMINAELEYEETNVVLELNKQIEYYQRLYLQTSKTEEKEKISRLIETTIELIDEYEQYMNPIQTRFLRLIGYRTRIIKKLFVR